MTSQRHYHHGRTPAAWWGSILAALGFLVAAIGFLMPLNWWVIGAGAVLVVAALIVAGTLRAVGYGQ